jgi:hypothetical protein
MLVFAASMDGDENSALRHAMDPGPPYPGGNLDDFADITTGFYQPPRMLILARFGRWKGIKTLAVEAEAAAIVSANATEAALADAVDMATAEGWTAAVANTPWGRAVWAYSAGLAAAAGWDEQEAAEKEEEQQEEEVEEEESSKEDGKKGDGVEEVDAEEVDAAKSSAAAVLRIPASDWLSHLHQLATEEVPEEDASTVIPGLTTRGGNIFARGSPFWHAKRQLAVVMVGQLYKLNAVRLKATDFNP